jgi:hypothetical protein
MLDVQVLTDNQIVTPTLICWEYNIFPRWYYLALSGGPLFFLVQERGDFGD